MKKMSKLIVAAAMFSGVTIAHSSSAATLYSQGFESGAATGFLTSSADLWHVTSNDAASGKYALGYVENETPMSSKPNGDYDGDRAGSIFTGPITLGTSPATLSLDAVNFNEIGDDPNDYDRLRIGVSLDGSTFDSFLASTSTDDAAATYFAPSAVGAGYTHLTLDLSAYASKTVYVGFNYTTEDGGDNGHPGARVDNILVSDATVAAVPEAATWATMLVGLGVVGGALRRRSDAKFDAKVKRIAAGLA